jgi:hypothetical protein
MTLRAIRLPLSALALLTLLLFTPRADAQEVASLPADSGAAATPVPADSGEEIGTADIAVPRVERPLKRLYCVEYARLRSGLAIFGDAKLWWARAKDLYDRFTQPAVDAVMVFSGSKRIRRGHLAVVSAIVSPREIIVDHANWQNHGEIDRNMPVLDVSADNDWSQVRVWDVNSSRWGARTYRISGFIGHSAALAGAGS